MENNTAHFRAVLDLIGEPLFILDVKGSCIFVNRAFRSLLSLEASSGNFPVSLFWPKFDRADLECDHVSVELCAANGDIYRARLSITPLIDNLRLIRAVSGSMSEGLQGNFHGQRLQTLGLLASGIAHDFNNVLAGILGHTSFLKTILPATGRHQDSLKAIEEGARKSALLTQQILNFSRSADVEKVTSLDLNELVVRACTLLRGAISSQFNLLTELPSRTLHVLADEARVAQVLVNLIVNARDALAIGGTIKVKLGVITDEAELKSIFAGQDLSSATFALLQVTDDGHGMPPEVLARVFEPYFSTKDERGTGLGLYTVSSIVKFYGGAVRIESSPASGTSVSVYWPVLEDAAAQSAEGDDQIASIKGGSETILIVDDEDPVRNVLTLSLKHLGYQVQVAGSGEEALSFFREHPTGIDLVILDMLMPDISGAEVFQEVRSLNPAARVLLMSGFASQDLVRSILSRGGRGFMQKPFTIEELSKKVRQCLELP